MIETAGTKWKHFGTKRDSGIANGDRCRCREERNWGRNGAIEKRHTEDTRRCLCCSFVGTVKVQSNLGF